jgi:penicillin-binding protein 1C
LVCALFAIMIADFAFPPDLSRYNNVSPEIVDHNGKLLRAFLTPDGYWRMKTAARDVSPRYIAMLKAYEDKRFDDHWGVDPIAILRATFQFAGAGHVVSGGSTLTMQVARLLEPQRSRGLGVKLFQMIRALQLEERYSKDEILSMYLTLAPFGGNLEGVRAASLSYFGKPATEIDLSEAALLVALPQSPVKQRPDRHAIRAAKGRDKVLARMVGDGIVTASDAAVARREGVPFARQPMPLWAPHLAMRLKLRNPQQRRIVTTLDAGLQAAVERLAQQETPYFGDGASLSIVVVENRTRNVLAYLGGVDYWGKSGQVDLAQRNRSPGSALKPFIYGMAFDELILHPSSMMTDAPTMFGDYAPKDFGGAFQGAVTARDALRESLNVPAVMTLDRVGPLAFTLNLQNAGAKLSFPTGDAPTLPVALGGLGISLADITMLYSGIAERGQARALRFIVDTPDAPDHRLFGPVAAFYLKQILRGVALPDGWAMGQGLTRARQVGFKTGTSYGFRDAWAVGFSNDYTIGVWVGQADGSPRPGHIGRDAAAPILLKTFGLLPADKRADDPPPSGALVTNDTSALPASMRIFRREQAPAPPKDIVVPPPAIAFPPNGTVVQLPPDAAKDHTIVLKADGGKAPLTWMVNGQLIGNYDRFQPVIFTPDGEGVARITVVDAQGRSDTSQVRFKKATKG